MHDWDAIVIGAGAAGLMAALTAAERGRRTLLIEKNRKAGVKILISGGTRCNLTHDCDERGIMIAFGRNGHFLGPALARFTPRDAVAFFNAEGITTKREDTGKIFPASDRALDVRDALVARLRRAGATLALGEPVRDLRPQPGGGVIVETAARTLTAASVVVTTGGLSFPGCGTTGDGYTWLTKLGHTLAPTRPALVPLRVSGWVGDLSGLTVPDAGLKVLAGDKLLAQRRGSLLFAHFGLTGPVALDVSRAVSGHPSPASLRLLCDLIPATADRDFDEFLREQSLAAGKKQLAVVLSERLPRRLADQVLVAAKLPADRRAAELKKDDRRLLVELAKKLPLPVTGTLGYEKAEVTAGGINLAEVDPETMRSRLVPDVFIAGEVLDLDGWIGGYNFQGAWSTGRLAGQGV